MDSQVIREDPFADLRRFSLAGDRPGDRPEILLLAPLSGHHATLLRPTVARLLRQADVVVSDWRNARDVPVDAGSFDIEDWIHLVEAWCADGARRRHLVAVCQPVPLALAACARMAARSDPAQPASLTLMGGPVDPDAPPSKVSDFGRRTTMEALEHLAIQRVGSRWAGRGRRVYPGLVQLSAFIGMNPQRHAEAFSRALMRLMERPATAETDPDQDRFRSFYDEYLAVMDLPAEFYLSTVERIFKARELPRGAFTVDGVPVDPAAIEAIPVMVVEGEKDDISAPGQCAAAFDLMPNLPRSLRFHHLEPGAGHYGIFAGRRWEAHIAPRILSMVARADQSP